MKLLPGPRYNVWLFIITGLVFHYAYIPSIFDCYFASTLVSGMDTPTASSSLANRLVLIVGDGVRADLLFSLNSFEGIPGSPEITAPYLRSVTEHRGAFGISHTRVPTLTRPGHVSIFAGTYEEMTAVRKAWSSEPVEFDTIFNRSSATFAFGFPGALSMFGSRIAPGKMWNWSYKAEELDYTKDATARDFWVLDQVGAMFQNLKNDTVLANQINSDKTVFFLSLGGLDTTGHFYRPHSKEYMHHIQVVDRIVQKLETLFTEYFQDDKTSFIFTADHGMSVTGNHGDGHSDNTRTPLIAWGAGIRGPLPDSVPSSHDKYSSSWGLNHLLRRDVEQVDISALAASLLGLQWPAHSIGILPDADASRPGYLTSSAGEELIARATYANANTLLEHYRIKHETNQERRLFYKPFKVLEGDNIPPRLLMLRSIQTAMDAKDWTGAHNESFALIQAALTGIHYLQTYDCLLIRIIVSVGYIGWAAHTLLYILRLSEVAQSPITSVRTSTTITALSLLVLLYFWTVFTLQHSPWTYYVYILFPCYFWAQFLVQMPRRQIPTAFGSTRPFIPVLLAVGSLQVLVLAYSHREIWTYTLIMAGVVWPIVAWPRKLLKDRSGVYPAWICSCTTTAVFHTLPVDAEENLLAVMSGGALMLVFGITFLFYSRKRAGFGQLILLTVLLLIMALAMWVTHGSVRSLQDKRGLPAFNQYLGWILLLTSSLLPLMARVKYVNAFSKTIVYFIGFGVWFILLAINTEGLYYSVYSITLQIWIKLESTLREEQHHTRSEHYRFRPDDLRIAIFFLFFIQFGFFGAGNVASIVTFNLEPVYRLVTKHNPFLVLGLLMLKIIVPHVVLSISFATLNAQLRLPPFSLLFVAVALIDVATLTLFHQVSDTGSWSEIDQSIGHFCVASLLLIYSIGSCAAGEYLMADTFGVGRQEHIKMG